MIWPWRKQKLKQQPELDAKWQALKSGKTQCSSCGQRHSGVFDLACAHPLQWNGRDGRQPNQAVTTNDHVLTEDFCILNGEHFFVRSVLQIPIIDAPGETFAYGVWSSLSKTNFESYVKNFDDDTQHIDGPWFGWFSNMLKGYPSTLNLKCEIHPRPFRNRPLLELEPTDHLLAKEQRNGISIKRLFELYHLNGHNLSSTLE